MGMTLSISKLHHVLTKVTYFPHPIIGKHGQILCTGLESPGREKDDTCILISSGSRIDITADITLGKWVVINSGAHIITHNHPLKGRSPIILEEEKLKEKFVIPMPKIIGDDVWIFQSIILPQCQKVARGVIIGTGSIVTKDIMEPYSIWAGNPAKKIGVR